MPYRLKRKESVADGVARAAREEAEKALAAVTGGGRPADERIHDARTRCKKLRGLLRLVRPHLGDLYREENARLRDAARPLSAVRDAAVVLKAFDELARGGRLERETV
ncbi:MAG TPA: CHAD domain-containing protein, partial [Planctomycetaceae bacterium]